MIENYFGLFVFFFILSVGLLYYVVCVVFAQKP